MESRRVTLELECDTDAPYDLLRRSTNYVVLVGRTAGKKGCSYDVIVRQAQVNAIQAPKPAKKTAAPKPKRKPAKKKARRR